MKTLSYLSQFIDLEKKFLKEYLDAEEKKRDIKVEATVKLNSEK
jgi:hypothetical protein